METAFPVLYTKLVKEGILPLDRLIGLLHDAPGERFGIAAADRRDTFAVWDLVNIMCLKMITSVKR